MISWLRELAAELLTIEVPNVERAEYERQLEIAYNHYLRQGYDHESAGESAHRAVESLRNK